MESVNFLTPVGRMVMGSLYDPQTKNAEGQPLVIKNGPHAGEPASRFFFALAIPKGTETHWAQTDWGRIIYGTAVKAWPNGQHASPAFSWKIVDGDSAIPNTKGVPPNTREGYKGHWVISFSSSFAPKIYNRNGSQALNDKGAVKCGDYLQVAGTVAGNESTQKPGIYINHSMIALAGYGQEIHVGPDPTSVGFGAAPLPAGASAVPLGGLPAVAPVPTAQLPVGPVAPVTFAAPNPMIPLPVAPVAPVAVVPPNPAFLNVPPAQHQLTEKAMGSTYDQLISAGWTDALLVKHGLMFG